MTDLITPVHRPDFASVQLAADLQKLEEDWLRLEHRAKRANALDPMTDLDRIRLLSAYRLQATLTRAGLMHGNVTFSTALVVMRMLEAAFHIARRALNGLEPTDPDHPVPYWPIDEDDEEWPAEEACS